MVSLCITTMSTALARFRLVNVRATRTQWKRSLSCIVAIMIGTSLLVAIAGIYSSLTMSVATTAEDLYGNAVFEVTGAADSGLPESLVTELRGVDGVAAAEPVIKVTTKAPALTLLGVGPEIRALGNRVGNELVEQAQHDTSHGSLADGAIAGPGLQVRPGDSITVNGVAVPVVFVPSGDLARKYGGGTYLIVSLPMAQRLTQQAGRVSSVFIVARAGVDPRRLGSDLVRVVDHRAVVAAPQFRVDQTDSSLALTRNALLLAGSIALVVAMFIVFNTMNMAVVQRGPMIATLRALGARRWQLTRDLLLEVILMGLLGGCLGAPLGAALGFVAITRLPPMMVQSIDIKPEYFFPGSTVVVVIALGVLTCLAGAAWPALTVFRASPVSAMRPAEIALTESKNNGIHWAGTVLGFALIAGSYAGARRIHGERAFVAGVLVLAGVLTLGWALGPAIVSSAGRLASLMGPSGQVSRSTMSQSPTRTWGNIMIVTIAVALGSATNGVLTDVIDSTAQFFTPLAYSDVYVSTVDRDEMPIGPLVPPGIDDALRAIPGVASVVPVQYAFVNVSTDRVLVVGGAPHTVTPAFASMDPALRTRVSDGDGVVISRQLANLLHRGTGDTLTLSTPSGERTAPIAGVVDYLTTERGMIALSLAHMQSWFQRDGATYLEVHLRTPTDPHTARATLDQVRHLAAAHGLFAYTGTEALEAGREAITQIGSLAVFVQWIVALLAAIALFNAFMIAVIERTREIGVLRAMGASRRYITRSILVESTCIAAVGGALGLLASLVVHVIGTQIMTSVTAMTVRVELSPRDLLTVAVAALVCWSGALLPALRATKSNIVDALEVR